MIVSRRSIATYIVLFVYVSQVKHRNVSAHKRLRDMISNSAKKFFVFSNEHHRETFVEIEAGESANDRNDRAIRTAVQWYNKHLEGKEGRENGEAGGEVTKVVLITNDRDNREKARALSLPAFTALEYAQSLTENPGLVDRLANLDEASENGQKREKILFPEHLPLSVIQSGLKSGRYLQGTFRGSRQNYLEGHVSIPSMEKWVFVQGLQNLNRAVHEDTVAVELFPESEWSCPSGLVMRDAKDQDNQAEDKESESGGGETTRKAVDPSLLEPTGKVVGIIRRNWRPYCGTLLPLPSMKGTRHTCVPTERRIPRVRLGTRQAPNLLGRRIVVSIDSWPRSSRFPCGHFVRDLGEIGDKATENEVLLLEHEVPHQSFSQAVLADLPRLPWTISDEDRTQRRDLRHLDVCSVDPPGCTDIDDALHCRELENRNLEVGVHIADVSHFIRPGTALDREAADRGTTVYLADMRIDMVPELLSSNLCSLRGGEERFAFSVLWEMNRDADIVSTRFKKSVIRSRAALTYAEAQMRIDDPKQSDAVTVSLRHLNRLAKILKQGRIEKGALTLASPEVRFEVDSETHDPIDLQTKELRETNSLVEEFMLLANISVAQHITQHFPHCALLRRHPAPPLSNYNILIKAGKVRDIPIQVETAKALANSLEGATVPDEPYFNTMLRIMATRCMMQAVYFCSGTLPPEEYYHYGLAMPIYTHFTSPIRRYSDLVVHRLLAVAVRADLTHPDLLDKHKAQTLCNHLNHRHKMAQYSARASVRLHTEIFFRDKSPVEEGFVLFVRRNALQVLIPRYGVEGMVFFDGEPSETVRKTSVVFDDEVPSLTVEGVGFRLFDRVTVRAQVEKSSIQQSKLKLYLVSPVIPGLYPKEEPLAPPPSKRPKYA